MLIPLDFRKELWSVLGVFLRESCHSKLPQKYKNRRVRHVFNIPGIGLLQYLQISVSQAIVILSTEGAEQKMIQLMLVILNLDLESVEKDNKQ